MNNCSSFVNEPIDFGSVPENCKTIHLSIALRWYLGFWFQLKKEIFCYPNIRTIPHSYTLSSEWMRTLTWFWCKIRKFSDTRLPNEFGSVEDSEPLSN